jgi:hypothetical protein
MALLVVCAMPAAAQQGEASSEKQCAVFTIQDFSSGPENKDYEQPITDSVSAAFTVGGYGIIPADAWGTEAQKRSIAPRSLLDEATATSIAQAVGADLAVTGYFTVQDDKIYISLQCWDVAAGALAAGLQQTARFNIAFYSSLHDKVSAMLPEIRLQGRPAEIASTPVGTAAAARQPTVSDLTFLSPDEGMDLYVAGDTRIGTISQGKFVWRSAGLVPGSRFSVEKRKSGYHPSSQTVRASSEIRLSRLEGENKHAVEADWTLGQLLGLGAALRLYFQPDTTFSYVSNYFFLQPALTSAGSPVVHDDLSIGFGTYLIFPPESWIRLGVSAGVGSIFSSLTGPTSQGYTDFYLDVFNWWVETRVLGPVIFLRQEWKYDIGGGSSLLPNRWLMVSQFPPMTLGVMFRW